MRTLVMFWIGWFVKEPKIKFRCNVGMIRDPSSVIPGFWFSGKRVRPYWYSHTNSAQCHQRFFLSSCQLSGMMTELSKLVLLHFSFPTPWDPKPFCCLHQHPPPLPPQHPWFRAEQSTWASLCPRVALGVPPKQFPSCMTSIALCRWHRVYHWLAWSWVGCGMLDFSR